MSEVLFAAFGFGMSSESNNNTSPARAKSITGETILSTISKTGNFVEEITKSLEKEMVCAVLYIGDGNFKIVWRENIIEEICSTENPIRKEGMISQLVDSFDTSIRNSILKHLSTRKIN